MDMKWIIYLVVMVSLAACVNTGRLYTKAQEEAPYDAIIVPGVPYGDDNFSDVMSLRIRWAAFIYRTGMAKNIIFSGGAVYNEYTESKIMAMYAEQLGVKPEHILIDTLAEHSTENLFYSWHVARANGLDRVALATDPFQTAMLRSFKRKMKRRLGANIDLIPTVFDTVRKLPRDFQEIDATQAIDPTPADIDDTQTKAFRWKGTMGWHIDWNFNQDN